MDIGGDPKKYPAYLRVGDCPQCMRKEIIVRGILLKNKLMVYICDICFTKHFNEKGGGGGIRV